MVAAGYVRGGCLEATEEQARCCAVRFTGCAATRAGRVGCESEPGALNSEARVVSVLYQKHHSYDGSRRVPRTDPRFCRLPLGPLLFALQHSWRPRKAHECIEQSQTTASITTSDTLTAAASLTAVRCNSLHCYCYAPQRRMPSRAAWDPPGANTFYQCCRKLIG